MSNKATSLNLKHAARKYGAPAHAVALYRVPARPLLPAAHLPLLAALSAFYWALLARAVLMLA